MDYLASNESETEDIARKLALELRAGDVLLLHGNLGMGKSVFARALIRALCGDLALEVPSPTFTLVQAYDSAQGPLWHFDLYRLEDPEEIYELGWEEALAEGIAVIEWPERLGPLMPPHRLDIRLVSVDNNPHARRIHISRT